MAGLYFGRFWVRWCRGVFASLHFPLKLVFRSLTRDQCQIASAIGSMTDELLPRIVEVEFVTYGMETGMTNLREFWNEPEQARGGLDHSRVVE